MAEVVSADQFHLVRRIVRFVALKDEAWKTSSNQNLCIAKAPPSGHARHGALLKAQLFYADIPV